MENENNSEEDQSIGDFYRTKPAYPINWQVIKDCRVPVTPKTKSEETEIQERKRFLNSKIDYSKVTDNQEVVALLKKRTEIELQIVALDDMALLNLELEYLSISCD